MALDKQKLLSELGSVMNQLQGADCGCMGKIFANPNQSGQVMGNSGNALRNCGGCRHGCCHGRGAGHSYSPGYTNPSAGEPHTPMNHHCMGNSNPPKLFADTYGYLNQNLMQPVVREVYNDLKSITPENTVMNSPMANQMGLPDQTHNSVPIVHDNMENMTQNHMSKGEINNNSIQNMNNLYSNQQMGGMGPQILNMMLGDGGSNSKNMKGQSGQIAGSQSPGGVTSLNAANINNSQYNSGMGMPTGEQGNTGMRQPNITNMYGGRIEASMNSEINPIAQNNIEPSQQMGNVNVNSGTHQQMATNHQPYGQHFQGVAKFKEMFPGVMQGLGGDLNFDPMAVALQMNPDNKQRAAMDTMKNVFGSNSINKVPNAGQPTSNQVQQNIRSGNQQLDHQITNPTSQITASQEYHSTGDIHNHPNQIPQQQVYSVVTENPTMNQLQPQYQQLQYHTQYQQPAHQQQNLDQNNVVIPPTLPTLYEGSIDSNAAMQQHLSPHPISPVQQIIKEPIFPVNTTKNRDHSMKQYECNTLGQPVQMLPARMYHIPEPNLPQTLAPQVATARLRNDSMRYGNVKSTVSKTSLMGNLPLGKTPSRSQLQQIYNQYKGSQSYTQQNIRASGHGGTQSEGQLKIAQQNANRQVPVERIGGDTIANNQMAHNLQIENKVEQVMGHIGDVHNVKPQGDVVPQMEAPSKHSRCRNGLQDMVYTSSPSSVAWSFHGNSRAPFSYGYRFRNKA